MRILFVHGWLMNEQSLLKLRSKFERNGHECYCYSIPGLAYKTALRTKWTHICNAFQCYLEAKGPFDVIIAHSLGCTLVLSNYKYLGNAKLVLLSPLCNNLTSQSKRMLKLLPLLGLGRLLPTSIIQRLYASLMDIYNYNTAHLRRIANGFYTCSVLSAISIIKEAKNFKFKPRGKLDNELVIVTGNKDRLVLPCTDNIERYFNFSVHYYKDCGHDTFNYLYLSEVL